MYSNFEASKPPVDPSKLRVRGGRTIEYGGDTYKIRNIDRSTRKDKKYVATVENTSKSVTHKVHWGNTNYDDYYVHRDKDRRDNFQKRHGAIKLKDGRVAANDPKQPAFYATKANWSYMTKMAMFSMDNLSADITPDAADIVPSTANDAPIVKRLGRYRDLRDSPSPKLYRKLSIYDELDQRHML